MNGDPETNPRGRPRVGPGRAFTLIKLLVTLAVTAMLAALLLPALAGPKARVRSVRCLSNLRQVGIAARLYADDNEGRLPAARALPQPGTNKAGQMPPMHQVLVSYIGGSNGVFQCPADPRRPFDGSSYDWNESFSGQLLDLVSPPWRS